MHMKKIVFLLALIFILSVLCFSIFQVQSLAYETKFESNGFLFNNLYWLRDKETKNFAEWIFCSIPKNDNDFILEINALATDISGGGWRPSAKLLMSYGEFNLSNNQVTKLENKNIALLNVSTIGDINEYWCRGIVKIPKSILNS